MKPTVAILGAGRTGRALGRMLHRQGFLAGGIACRTMSSARQAVAFIGGGTATTSVSDAVGGAGLVLIATPDRVIAPLARELAGTGIAWKNRTVFHTSGALSAAVLEPLTGRGAMVASLHPLASIPDPRAVNDLQGIPCAVEGDPRAVRALRRLTASLGGVPITIPRQSKALYHFIACLLSNDLVAFLDYGFDAARGLGLTRRQAARLYMPLVRGTLANVDRLGTVKALTGPVSRGDRETLRLHGEALRTLAPEVRRLHRVLALRSVELALQAKTIAPETAADLVRLLRSLP